MSKNFTDIPRMILIIPQINWLGFAHVHGTIFIGTWDYSHTYMGQFSYVHGTILICTRDYSHTYIGLFSYVHGTILIRTWDYSQTSEVQYD